MLSKQLLWNNLIRITYNQSGSIATATPVDITLFDAIDTDYEVVAVSEVHSAAGTDGSAVTGDVKRSSAGTTVTGGTSVLASTFNLKSTIDTPVRKTTSNGGMAQTLAGRVLSKGQRLGWDFGGTLTALEGVCVTVILRPMRRPSF